MASRAALADAVPGHLRSYQRTVAITTEGDARWSGGKIIDRAWSGWKARCSVTAVAMALYS